MAEEPTRGDRPEGRLRVVVVPEEDTIWWTLALVLGNQLLGLPPQRLTPEGGDAEIASALLDAVSEQVRHVTHPLPVTEPLRFLVVTPGRERVSWQELLVTDRDRMLGGEAVNADYTKSEMAALPPLMAGRVMEWPVAEESLFIGGPVGAMVAARVTARGIDPLADSSTMPPSYLWSQTPTLVHDLIAGHFPDSTQVRVLLGRGVDGYGLKLTTILRIRSVLQSPGLPRLLIDDHSVARVPLTAVVYGALINEEGESESLS